MTTTLALAGLLRTLPQPELLELLRLRQVRPNGIHDHFDLAEVLLDPAAVQGALSRLDRAHLTVLTVSVPAAGDESAFRSGIAAATNAPAPAAVEGVRTELVRMALIAPEAEQYVVWDAVGAVLGSWPDRGLPSAADLTNGAPPAALQAVAEHSPAEIDRRASEQAYLAQAAVADLLRAIEQEPARELSKGGLALPDGRRLTAATARPVDELPGLLSLADRAGLVVLEGGVWTVTETSVDYLGADPRARWAMLADAWQQRIPAQLRELLAERATVGWGHALEVWADWVYPAGGPWLQERVQLYSRDAELLGIASGSVPGTAASLLFGTGVEAAADRIAQEFPPVVEQVYLQHDLSVVSPGPLRADLDARLRRLADAESHDIATTYRITTETVNRAISLGETAASIREFLGVISLTGIPQPLEYLLDDTSARHGRLKVGKLEDYSSAVPIRSYVRSEDAELLSTLLVDQSLRPLALRRHDGSRLTSRFDRDVVFWALADARYPVVAEDQNGAPVGVRRQRAPRTTPIEVVDDLAGLAARLTASAQETPTGTAWLARQIEAAIRAKATLQVIIAMPDGSQADYLLEPASLAGGRMRARDRRVDIERTLPISSIVSISAAVREP